MADDFSVGATPADEITKDLSVLKNVSDLSQLTKEDREKAEKIVKNLLDSLLSGKDITPDKARENKDILKDLAGKGLDSAKQAMEKVEEQTNKSRTNFDESNFSPLEAKSHGHLKETIKKLSLVSEGPMQQENLKNYLQFNQFSNNKTPPKDMADFMNRKYASNSPDRAKFELLGPDKDRNEGRVK